MKKKRNQTLMKNKPSKEKMRIIITSIMKIKKKKMKKVKTKKMMKIN